MNITCPSCSTQNRVPPQRLGANGRCGQCKSPIVPPNKPLAIHSSKDFDELVRSSPLPVVVDFWADWCGPCKMIAPELEKLSQAKAGRVVITKVDTEELPDLAARFAIRGIPTLIGFQNGKEWKRVSGAMNASAIASAFKV